MSLIADFFWEYGEPAWDRIIGAIVAVALTFVIADCSAGKHGTAPGQVLGHEYHPPYMTMICSGKPVHCTPIFIPEEWHLIVDVPSHGDVDVQTGRSNYFTIKDAANVSVGFRAGRWTHYWYNRSATLATW